LNAISACASSFSWRSAVMTDASVVLGKAGGADFGNDLVSRCPEAPVAQRFENGWLSPHCVAQIGRQVDDSRNEVTPLRPFRPDRQPVQLALPRVPQRCNFSQVGGGILRHRAACSAKE
jgi:hypothetical protein